MTIFCVWLSPKRNFLKKVAFWTQAKLKSKTRFIYGPQRSINENAQQRVLWFVTVGKAFTQIPLISQSLRHTDKRTKLISLTLNPHPFALHAARLIPLLFTLDFCALLCALLRGKLLPLLLLSFFRLLQRDFDFFFFF